MKPLRKDRAALAGQASAAAAKVESSPPIPDPAAGAFFDVDNTLMRGASIYYFARGLAARKMFGPMDLARMAWGQACYRMRGAENADHIDAAREAALTFVAGHRVSDIVSLCEEIYDDTMADRIWEGTRELAQRHLEAGQRVWLVTASPVELATASSPAGSASPGRSAPLPSPSTASTPGGWSAGCCTARRRRRRSRPWPRAKAWTWPAAPPTATPRTTCRCSAWSGIPPWSTPTRSCGPRRGANHWPVHDFRSGRRATLIALPTAAGAGAVAGGIVAGLALRRRHAAGR